MSRVLVIGDTHFPFVREDYLGFLVDVYNKYDCDTVVHIGDVVDHHGISFHESEHDAFGAEQEMDLATEYCRQYSETFPECKVCIGNHDELILRRCRSMGMSLRVLREIGDIYETGDWEWGEEWIIDNVIYRHGTGNSGKNHAFNLAMSNRMSTVAGHVHTNLFVHYDANKFGRIFGMNVGCGIDDTQYAFRYGKVFPKRSIIGCGVVIDGVEAVAVPMNI